MGEEFLCPNCNHDKFTISGVELYCCACGRSTVLPCAWERLATLRRVRERFIRKGYGLLTPAVLLVEDMILEAEGKQIDAMISGLDFLRHTRAERLATLREVREMALNRHAVASAAEGLCETHSGRQRANEAAEQCIWFTRQLDAMIVEEERK